MIFLISPLKDVKCHPVLNAAGHVEMFGLGINDAFLTAEGEADGEQRCIADHVLQLFEACGYLRDRNRSRIEVDMFDSGRDLALHRKWVEWQVFDVFSAQTLRSQRFGGELFAARIHRGDAEQSQRTRTNSPQLTSCNRRLQLRRPAGR